MPPAVSPTPRRPPADPEHRDLPGLLSRRDRRRLPPWHRARRGRAGHEAPPSPPGLPQGVLTSMRHRLAARLLPWSLGLLMALAMMGCGGAEDTLPREPIWGRVTLDGSPLKAGMI